MTHQNGRQESESDLLELIGTVLNGQATETEQAQLSDRLAADADARRTYRSYINLHVGLKSYGDVTHELTPPTAAITADDASLHLGATSLSLKRLLSIAAAILIAVLLRVYLTSHSQTRTEDDGRDIVATITRTSAARWGDDSAELTLNAPLKSGSLDLLSGFAEITFLSGTTVVMEAPVRIDLISASRASLRMGRIVAHVPAGAEGFSIDTPNAQVIDLGTEFGVGVRESGDTEVQVFRGEVIAAWNDPQGKRIDQHLTEGKALSIAATDASSPRDIPFQPERFVRMFPSDRIEQPGGPLYNRSRLESVHVVPAPSSLTLDGDLSDWDRSGAFYSACFPPYHETHYVEGAMMFDAKFLYIAAHVGDPAPMLSKMDPKADPGQYAWRGGSVIVRLAVDPAMSWPLDSMGRAEADSKQPSLGTRPQDVTEKIVHATMWYHQPSGKPRLHLSYGMDFHGERIDPAGWSGAIRMDPNGLGYTIEYAIPWSLLNAGDRPPRQGDVLAANWTVHWSDLEGSRSRGHLVEITNAQSPAFRFLRGTTWGKAIFHEQGSLPPQTVRPRK